MTTQARRAVRVCAVLLGHKDPADHEDCPGCYAALYDARYQRLFGLPVTAPASPPTAFHPQTVAHLPACPPAAPQFKPPCRHEGDVVSFSCCRGEAGHIRYCTHPTEPAWDRCVRGPSRDQEIMSCAACPLYEKTPDLRPLVVNMGAGGLGDGLLGLLTVATVKAENPETRVIYRVGRTPFPFVRLFEGYDELRIHDWDEHGARDLSSRGELQLNHQYGLEMMTKSQMPRWERYNKNANVTRSTIPGLRDPERVRRLGLDYKGCVVVCPFSAFTDREFPPGRFREIEAALFDRKLRSVILHPEPIRPKDMLSEKLIGASPERVTGIIMNAALVIGLDSGLSHLAALLGRPTIVLCGQTLGEKIFGAYRGADGKPNVKSLYGPLACNGCYWQAPHNHIKCRPHCPSMRNIELRSILEEVDRALGAPAPNDVPPASTPTPAVGPPVVRPRIQKVNLA